VLFVNKYRALWKYPKLDQATRDDGGGDDYVWKNDMSPDLVTAAPRRGEWLA